MSINRHAKRRDSNEPEIIEALVLAGARVKQMDLIDLIVHTTGKQVYLVEVKTPTGELTSSQKDLIAKGFPVHVVRSPEDALKVIEGE